MTPAERINLVLRATLELGVVLGFGYWGFHTLWLCASGHPAARTFKWKREGGNVPPARHVLRTGT